MDYLLFAEKQCAKTKSLHEPHVLQHAFRMYTQLQETGSMKLASWEN